MAPFLSSLFKCLNTFSAFAYLFGGHAERRSFSHHPGLNDAAGHDGVAGVEDEVGEHLDLAGEHGQVLELLSLLPLQLLLVLREAVEQVVDNVGLEREKKFKVKKRWLTVPASF